MGKTGCAFVSAGVLLFFGSIGSCVYRGVQYENEQNRILAAGRSAGRLKFFWEFWPPGTIWLVILLIVVGIVFIAASGSRGEEAKRNEPECEHEEDVIQNCVYPNGRHVYRTRCRKCGSTFSY